jgi:glycosyltransferase involved in cell wall biosynthesis
MLVFGGYDARRHGRAEAIIDGIAQSDFDLEAVSKPLHPPPHFLVQEEGRFLPLLKAAASSSRQLFELLRAEVPLVSPSVVFIPHPGYAIAPLARRIFGSKAFIVVDFLTSAVETFEDHGRTDRASKAIGRCLDRGVLTPADLILVDTYEHLEMLPPSMRTRALVVPVGVSRPWLRGPIAQRPAVGPLEVLHFGSCAPLHGVSTMLAATKLTGSEISYTIVGPIKSRLRQQAMSANGSHVTFREWVGSDELRELVRTHHVGLGIFGGSPKAGRVVPTKLFQSAAAGQAIVTSASPPQQRLFRQVAKFVPPEDPASIARELTNLASDRELVRILGERARLLATMYSSRLIVEPLVRRLQARC